MFHQVSTKSDLWLQLDVSKARNRILSLVTGGVEDFNESDDSTRRLEVFQLSPYCAASMQKMNVISNYQNMCDNFISATFIWFIRPKTKQEE